MNSYDLEDKEFKDMKYVLRDFGREIGPRFILWEFSPIFRLIDKKRVNKMSKLFKDTAELMKHKYISHQKDYSESIERDFCDALITAKNEALREGKESTPYLTDENLAMTIFDLFFAGTDTSQQTFQWLLILLSYYPEMQRKLRQEIETQIGDRMPTHEDRNRCHYVMAFIAETLRFRNIAPQGVPHRAVVRTTIGK
jgi:cytochrome P450